MSVNHTLIIHNAAQLVCISRSGERVKRGQAMCKLAVVDNGSLVVEDGRISWIGQASQCPSPPIHALVIDATGKTVLPGFIDSHIHLVFAGTREAEFEQRASGLTYQEIAARGGGINATVDRVRRTTKSELKEITRRRLDRLLRFGVTTVEIK